MICNWNDDESSSKDEEIWAHGGKQKHEYLYPHSVIQDVNNPGAALQIGFSLVYQKSKMNFPKSSKVKNRYYPTLPLPPMHPLKLMLMTLSTVSTLMIWMNFLPTQIVIILLSPPMPSISTNSNNTNINNTVHGLSSSSRSAFTSTTSSILLPITMMKEN